MRKYLLILLAFAPALSTSEPIPAEKPHAIKELVDITGARLDRKAFAETFIQQILYVLRARNPNLPPKAVEIVKEEVHAMVLEEDRKESLEKEIYPIYAKYLTLAELKGLIEFNESAAGRKANQVMPKLMQESMDAAQTWARELGPGLSKRVLRHFADEGIDINE